MDSPTCSRPDCHAGIIRVERCQEFRVIRYRWVCLSGHSGFLAADLPDYGRPVAAWGRRRHDPDRICGECREPLPPGSHYQRKYHAACSVERNARRSREAKRVERRRESDQRRQVERRSTRRAVAS